MKTMRQTIILGCFCLFAFALQGCEDERFKPTQTAKPVDVTTRLRAAPLARLHAPSQRPTTTPPAQATSRPVSRPSAPLRLEPTYGHSEAVRSLAVAPSGLFALTGGDDRQLLKWNLPKLKRIRRLAEAKGSIRQIQMFPSGRRFALLEGKRTLSSWRINGELTRRITVQAAQDNQDPKGQATFQTLRFASLENQLIALMTSGDLVLFHPTKLTSKKRIATCTHLKDKPLPIARSMALDPQERSIAVVCADGSLWFSTLDGTSSFHIHSKEPVGRIAFMPRSNLFVTAAQNKSSISLWSAQFRERKVTEIKSFFGHLRPVQSLRFSASGRRLLTSSLDCQVGIWAVTPRGLSLLRLLPHTHPVEDAALLPEKRGILSIDRFGKTTLWNRQGKRLTTTTRLPVQSAALHFSPKAHHLATAGGKGSFAVWDLPKAQRNIATQAQPNYILHVEYALDGKHFLSMDPDNAVFWDLGTRRAIDVIRPASGSSFSAAALGRDWTEVLVGTPSRGIQLWTIRGGPNLLYRHREPRQVVSLAVHPLSRRAAVGTRLGQVYLYNFQQYQLLQKKAWKSQAIHDLHFSPKGKKLLIVTGPHLRVLSLPAWKELYHYTHPSAIYAGRFSPDGQSIAFGGADTFVHWLDANTGKLLQTKTNQSPRRLVGCSSSVRRIAFSTHAPLLAASCRDGRVKLWSIPERKDWLTLIALEKHHWMVMNPALRFVASSGAASRFMFAKASQYNPLFGGPEGFFSVKQLQQPLAHYLKKFSIGSKPLERRK